MRYALFVIIALCIGCNAVHIPSSQSENVDHSLFSELLSDHVSVDGLVDYAAFQRDSLKLNKYLELLSGNPPNEQKWSPDQQLAYWINAYNAFTIKLITDHYPIQSIKDIKSGIVYVNTVWDQEFFKIGGVKMNLNNIEHGIIRKKFDEPRIHFAVNCAAMSCPKLLNEAYEGAILDQQLTRSTQQFFANVDRNTITPDKITISPILKWFKKDFTKGHSTLQSFVNTYTEQEIKPDAAVSFNDYDWSLNDLPDSK